MKQTVLAYDFASAFEKAGRGDQFSRPALAALFDYYEQLEQDTGKEIELDVVAICCDWTEYANAIEAAEAYGYEPPESDDERADQSEERSMEFLQDETHVIELESSILVLNF